VLYTQSIDYTLHRGKHETKQINYYIQYTVYVSVRDRFD
jgi:hypothetical protein